MELGTELDYEEEDCKSLDDEYLRIDLSEEEENFFSGQPLMEKESVKKESIRKVNKKDEGPHQENTSSKKGQFIQTSRLGESKNDSQSVAVKGVENKRSQLQLQFNKNKTTPQCLNGSLEEKLSVSQDTVKPPVPSSFNNQRLSLSRDSCSNRSKPIEPLLTSNTVTQEEDLASKRFRPLQTFSSNSYSRFPRQTLFQQRNEPLFISPLQSFHNGEPKFQKDERRNFYRNPAFQNDVPKVRLSDECIKRSDILPKPKPDISKELLLKKRNPFDTKVEELPGCVPAIKVKEEEKDVVSSRLLNPDFVPQRLKEEEGGRSLSTSTCPVEAQVKFVRTVSKSFDELTQKNGYPPSQLRSFPFAQGSLKRSSPSKDPPQIRYRVLSRIF